MLRALRRPTLAVLATLAAATELLATDLHVPAQYATIQAAIIASAPGDRVLVQPGTYYEAIVIAGKGIEIIGVGGAAVTTIDATGLGNSVVSFTLAVPLTARLQGFTITGGTGQPSSSGGGGVYIGGDSCPTVRECVITGNSGSSGGGIFVGAGASPSNQPLVVDCVITGNQSPSGSGGGIRASGGPTAGWPVVRDCTIADNQAAYGGGCAGSGDFVDCVIEGNVATEYGGGAYSVHSLKGSQLRGNTAGSFGGGYYDYQIYGVGLSDCTLIENNAQFGGGAFLASDSPFPIFGPEAWVSGCVFARNVAAWGDGLMISFTSYVTSQTTIVNCSFDMNRYSGGGSTDVRNCIIRGVPAASPGAASYSNIEGGAIGPGNIDADPLWVDPAGGDYRLQGCSPCLDAGDPTSPLDPDGTTADMGGLAFAAWTDLGGGVPGSSGDGVLAGTGLLEPGSIATLSLTNAAPVAPTWLVLGLGSAELPFKGGTFWPTLDGLVAGLLTDAAGSLQLDATWPPLIGCGFTLYTQAWWPDAGAESGWAGSNGLRVVSR